MHTECNKNLEPIKCIEKRVSYRKVKKNIYIHSVCKTKLYIEAKIDDCPPKYLDGQGVISDI